MTRRGLRTLSGLALLTALVGGCADDVGVALPAGTGNVLAGTDATSTAPTTGADTTTTVEPRIEPDDSCHVEITGDVHASYDSHGGFSNISYGPWTPTAGTVVGISVDDTLFMLNCNRGDGMLVTFSLSPGQHLAAEPQTFGIRKADNQMGGYTTDPPVIQVSPFIGTGDFMYAVSADSTFTISEFDATHVAGSFHVTVSEAKHGVRTDGLPPKTAVIDGTFDVKNPNRPATTGGA